MSRCQAGRAGPPDPPQPQAGSRQVFAEPDTEPMTTIADCCRRMLALDSKICDDSFMKITIDISEMELSAAMRFTKAKTKKAAIVTILADFNQRWRMAEATKVLGTSTTFMTRDELMKARCARRSL